MSKKGTLHMARVLRVEKIRFMARSRFHAIFNPLRREQNNAFPSRANLCATVVGGDNVRRTTARVVQPGAKHTLGLQQAWTGIQRHVPQQ
jgi:hypothetical protein